MKQLISFILKKALAISMVILAASAIFTVTGTILNRHENYYPALLCIIASGALLLFKSSMDFRSKKAFVLSLFTFLFIAVLIIGTVLDGHIVLAAADWRLGATCLIIYAVYMSTYLWLIHKEEGCNKNLLAAIAIFIASPFPAAAMFYCGAKAWIGLSVMVLLAIISIIAIRNGSIVKTKA